MATRWFDAHLDLAYMAERGRDLGAPLGRCAGPDLPASVTFPSLAEGRVAAALGTIFVEADGKDPGVSYATGVAAAAHLAGVRQLDRYATWAREGRIAPMRPGQAWTPHAAAETGRGARDETSQALLLGILVEGADPIRAPDELAWWAERGVVAVGMAWWKPSRYAGGNGTDLGLTDLGRALVREMDAQGIVHDASHLSDRALHELCDATDRPVIASHSNCRSLMDGKNQRHLTDDAIREIGGEGRGGVIGLNLYSKFLRQGLDAAEQGGARASIDDCIRHVEHVCEVVGHRRAVGLGSDMDGGFSALALPEGIDRPAHLPALAAALAARGWSDEEVDGFAWGNWARFWKVA